MGIKEWFGKRFKGQTDSKTLKSEEQTLASKGIQIISDGKLEHRISLLIDLEDEIKKPIETTILKEYVKELKKRNDLLNHGIMQIALPYARAGNDTNYAKKLEGWTDAYALANWWMLEAEKMVSTDYVDSLDYDEGNINRLLHMFCGNLNKFVWNLAFYFLGVCFMDVDIAPTAATVVQTMVQPRGGEGLNAIAQPSTEY